MADETHWTIVGPDFEATVFYTDDPVDPDAEHATEWVIRARTNAEEIARGWGRTPRHAREVVNVKLAELRARQGRS